MATSNVIEIVIKATDQASAAIAGVRGKVAGLSSSVSSALGTFKGLAVGLVGIASVGTAISKVISASKEAEISMRNFDRALQAFGANVKVPEGELRAFAEQVQRTTRFSDEAARGAQTVLLRFGNITGEAFKRAQVATLDLAEALGTDLSSAAQTVARALANPEQAARMLRSANIQLSESQRAQIKAFMDVNDIASAQKIILDELDKRNKGLAAGGVKTLSGALDQLKNSFDELFEADPGPMTEGVSALNKVVSDPAFRASVQSLFGAMLEGLGATLKAIGLVIEGYQNLYSWVRAGTGSAEGDKQRQIDKQQEVNTYLAQQIELQKKNRGTAYASSEEQIAANEKILRQGEARLKLMNDELFVMQGHASQLTKNAQGGKRGRIGGGDKEAVEDDGLSEVFIGATAAAATAQAEYLRQITAWRLNVRTELEEARYEWSLTAMQAGEAAAHAAADGITDNMNLSHLNSVLREQFNNLPDELQAELDAAGAVSIAVTADFDAAQEAAKIKKEVEAWEPPAVEIAVNIPPDAFNESIMQMNEAVDLFRDGFKSAFDDMIRTGKFSFRDMMKFILAELTKKALFSAIDNIASAMKSAFSSGGGSSGSGWMGTAVSFIGSLFGGGKAGGGAASGMTLVGEEGPEVVALPKGSHVYNQRQLAFAGGGASVNFAPVNNIAIVAQDKDAQTLRAEFGMMLARSEQRQSKQMTEILNRNGFGRMR